MAYSSGCSAHLAVATASRGASYLTHHDGTLQGVVATEEVDHASAIVALRESMTESFRRQGSIQEDVGAAPGRELGLGAFTGT